MSPALLSHAWARRTRLRDLLLAAFVGLVALIASSPAAHAATTTLSFTDPSGDAQGFDSLDLVSGNIVYDDSAGSITVTLTTKAPITTYPNGAVIQIALGQASSTGCATDATNGVGVGIFYIYPGPGVPSGPLGIWSVPGTNAGSDLTTTSNGNTITVSPNNDATGALKGLTLTCGAITTVGAGATSDDPTVTADTATALVQSGSTQNPSNNTKSNTTPLQISAPVTTTDPDADRDGTPDSADKCPTVPGAQKNGCPTMPPALEIRLGAKRVVIDKLLPRTTASSCPKLVRIHVTAKGKLIGNGVVTTSQFGSFCRVNGVIKTKKTVKAVRVTMTSTGLTSLAKSAHR